MERSKTLGFLLKDLSRRYVARFETHAEKLSLTLMQCKVLVILDKNEGASQARMAELTDIEPMMMVRLLDRMEGDKLIERRPDPQDRRARRLFLTKKAKPLLNEIWRLAEEVQSEMFTGIGKTDREVFLDVLGRLHANACALDKLSPPRDAVEPKRARTPRSSSTKHVS